MPITPPFSRLLSPFSPGSRAGAILQSYFRSGWAFLIPYLATYLLYAWLKWPVNPVDDGQWTVIPCLLHVFWALHAANLILGASALRNWWRGTGSTVTGATDNGNKIADRATSSQLFTGYRLLPWACLGLLFYIPGVYMEFPADPWEHYARINHWRDFLDVLSNPIWNKSSYFLGYSFLGRIFPPHLQLQGYDVYYTGCSLLLCWQYYRLARIVGLSERAGFMFVLVHALTFGNNIFGFYRYYGMSSSVLAQLGAVALTRIAIEALRLRPLQTTAICSLPTNLSPHSPGQVAELASASAAQSLGEPGDSQRKTIAMAGISGFALLPLIAFNHIQGLGIAALGVTAVTGWQLIERHRSLSRWLVAAAITGIMVAMLWMLIPFAFNDHFRSQDGLSLGHKFILHFSLTAAGLRSQQVLGVFGVLNLIAGLWLLRRNHVVGWLTMIPVLVLCLPLVAMLGASRLGQSNADSISSLQRMLFAIPAGLALTVSLSHFLMERNFKAASYVRSSLPFFALCSAFCALLVIPATAVAYNRLWHIFSRAPSDLLMRSVCQDGNDLLRSESSQRPGHLLFSYQPIGYIMEAIGSSAESFAHNFDLRRIGVVRDNFPTERIGRFSADSASIFADTSLYLPERLLIFTPESQAAFLSGHWLPQEVALNTTGLPEIHQQLGALPPQQIKHLFSGSIIVQRQKRPHSSLLLNNGIQLNFFGDTTILPPGELVAGWLPFRREKESVLRGSMPYDGRRFSSQAGTYKFKLRLAPAEGGADVLLAIDTLIRKSGIYLIHHRSGNRFYFYVGRNEIGPWAPLVEAADSEYDIEFTWKPNQQVLSVNGTVVLQSSLPTPNELVVAISIGNEEDRPERALSGNLLIQNLELTALAPTR